MAHNKKRGVNPAVNQKAASPRSGWVVPAAIVSVFAVLLAGGVLLAGSFSGGKGSDAGEVLGPAPADQDLVIPVGELSTDARFYPIDIDGTRLEVVAVKASDNTIRTAFNTCQVCYDSGAGYYVQQGDDLVCQNCGNRFAMSQVEVESGGCNPWPIFDENKTVTEDAITISYDYLKEAKVIFANWKGTY